MPTSNELRFMINKARTYRRNASNLHENIRAMEARLEVLDAFKNLHVGHTNERVSLIVAIYEANKVARTFDEARTRAHWEDPTGQDLDTLLDEQY